MNAMPQQSLAQAQADNDALRQQLSDALRLLAAQASTLREVEQLLYHAGAPQGTLVERVRFITSLLE